MKTLTVQMMQAFAHDMLATGQGGISLATRRAHAAHTAETTKPEEPAADSVLLLH